MGWLSSFWLVRFFPSLHSSPTANGQTPSQNIWISRSCSMGRRTFRLQVLITMYHGLSLALFLTILSEGATSLGGQSIIVSREGYFSFPRSWLYACRCIISGIGFWCGYIDSAYLLLLTIPTEWFHWGKQYQDVVGCVVFAMHQRVVLNRLLDF